MTLTEKGIKIFFEEKTVLFQRKQEQKAIINPESITAKTLFYSNENQKQIDMLKTTLMQQNLTRIQSRLRTKGLSTGICVLLYGAPGTGKTESVYQLAKATGRQIIPVDISKTKSCWFGESEKLIRKIFSDYKKICEERKDTGNHNIPILLFNEADAVLQKRTKNVHVSIEKTENAIQNIILENMEKFEGILIATTNLAINLDEAFERRFLYKIEFQNPPLEAKTSIWHSKLNWLSTDNAKILAKKYNFSGGEIDNIVRKVTLEEILTRKQVSLNKLEEMCVNEKLHTDNPDNRIGFVLDNEDCF